MSQMMECDPMDSFENDGSPVRKRVGKACDRCRNKKSKVRFTENGSGCRTELSNARTQPISRRFHCSEVHTLTTCDSAMERCRASDASLTMSSACTRSAIKLMIKSGLKGPWRRCRSR